jgi:PhzF family phenazine biosynthesis protein
MKPKCARIPIFQVNAFTDRLFGGNPAAVCLVHAPLPARLMQQIAAEMQLSETAFLIPLNGNFKTASEFRIRWFTPVTEVPLCGHATLAAASVVFSETGNSSETLFLESKSGRLTARKGAKGWILDFPSNPPHPCEVPTGILDGLGIKGPIQAFLSEEAEMFLLPMKSCEEVLRISPDFSALLSVNDRKGAQGVIVTALGPEGFDFCSRYFGPWEGINEDPVTGSAHTVLAPYWHQILGKSDFVALQASKRSGVLRIRLDPGGRVLISGETRIFFKGVLCL